MLSAFYYLVDTDPNWFRTILATPPKILLPASALPRDPRAPGGPVGDSSPRQDVEFGCTPLAKALAVALAESGYRVVRKPGPKVLQLSTTIIDLIDAPCAAASSGWSPVLLREEHVVSLVLEIRSSLDGILMARVVDHLVAAEIPPAVFCLAEDDGFPPEAEPMIERWAALAADRMARLEGMWPISLGRGGGRRDPGLLRTAGEAIGYRIRGRPVRRG